jgi:two-component system chemotaxis response regulator CheB
MDESSQAGEPGNASVSPDAPYAIIGIAASAGGLMALTEVLAALPADLPVPVVVVQHLDPRHRSLMAEILDRRTALQVREAQEGDDLRAGTVYIAPPDYHLLVNGGGTLSLSQSKLVHFVRPSADLLFESMAASYGDRAIAVVLSGSGKDGSLGVEGVKRMGGTVIVQEIASAQFGGMPAAAIETGCVDFVLCLDEIAGALITLVTGGKVKEA